VSTTAFWFNEKGKNFTNLFLYKNSFLAGGNIIKVENSNNSSNSLQKLSRLKDQTIMENNNLHLYNLITDKQIITINCEYFGDYNCGFDVPLNFYLN